MTQWAGLYITLEQEGIILPQKNKEFNYFEKLENCIRDKRLRVEIKLKVVLQRVDNDHLVVGVLFHKYSLWATV